MKQFFLLLFLFVAFTSKSQSVIRSDYLILGKKYYSPNNAYYVVFENGNLEVKTSNDGLVWQSPGTNNQGGTRCGIQNDGNLVVYRDDMSYPWQSQTDKHLGSNPYLQIQDDGNLVIYACVNCIISPLWSSKGGKISDADVNNFAKDNPNGEKCSTCVWVNNIKISGSYNAGSPGWDRDMQTTMHCGNSPESWVRGSAALDPSSGILAITIQLETDAVNAGPKGKITAILYDANHKKLADVTTSEIGVGGKMPGTAAIRNFSSQLRIDTNVASKVASIYLEAQCTGSVDRLFNISLDNLNDAFTIAITLASL